MPRAACIRTGRTLERAIPARAEAIQSGDFGALGSVTVLPTGILVVAPMLRIAIVPNGRGGLAKPSDIRVDKPQTPPRNRLGPVSGRLDDATMVRANRVPAVFLGLA